MDQRTHSWIAIRAIALLADEDPASPLAALLGAHATHASVGAWIPDQADAKRGGASSATENHVLKIEPYAGAETARFTTLKPALCKRLGARRQVTGFLKDDASLGADWWGKPYRGDVPKPGQHLPNRAMALGTSLKDLLLLGDGLMPGKAPVYAKDMDANAKTRQEAAALYFFMLSHFVADASMPCHCDARKLSAYGNGLHHEWETHWADLVGGAFEKKKLLVSPKSPDAILDQARDVDAAIGLSFDGTVPALQPNQDVWLELVNVCRASFAVMSVVAPPGDYPYDKTNRKAPFGTVFAGSGTSLLETIDRLVLHDAVLNTAIVWKDVWTKVLKLD
jgi:hypothetical protein